MSVSPRRPKGPPLNALRAFEAAARLDGFVAAAEELSVTPGAISQHVKALEAWSGVPLFRRSAQGVSLTGQGRSLLPVLGEAFDRLDEAARAIQDLKPLREVHLATLPSLAQIYVSPRLSSVRKNLPDVRISVTALEKPPNLGREMYDISLFLRHPAEVASPHVLEMDEIYPVAAPDVAAHLTGRADFADVPLLHDRTWSDDWSLWAGSAGVDIGPITRGAHYSLYAVALEEAKAGAGVLMGHDCLVRGAVARGELVALSDIRVRTGLALIAEQPRRHAGGRLGDLVEALAMA